MSKWISILLGFLLLIFQTTLLSAATVEFVGVYTDNRASWGYIARATLGISGDVEQDATLTLTKDPLGSPDTINIPVETYFFDQTSFEHDILSTPPDGFGGTPENLNGELLRFTLTDPLPASSGGGTDIKDIDVTVSGFTKIEMMDNFQVTSGGLNPTIGWDNPIGNSFHTYRIRVLDSLNDLVFDSPNLGYSALGGADGSFWFDPNERDLGGGKIIDGFTFTAGEDYTLRVEAREWLNNNDWEESYRDDTFYVNRSVTQTGFTAPVPIPGAIWLLGTGLIGLVGIKRKFKN